MVEQQCNIPTIYTLPAHMTKIFQPRSSANRCPSVQKEMVNSSSWNSSNIPWHAGTLPFVNYHGHTIARNCGGDAKNAAAARSDRLHHRHRAMRISRVADSATRSARTMTDGVLPRSEEDSNF